jgi:LEA14-like dessication related protein
MAGINFDDMISVFKDIILSTRLLGVLMLALVISCVPKEQVVFKGVKNISVREGSGTDPELTADAFFYNPNNVKMKLKEINVDVLVNGKRSAQVRQDIKLDIPAQGDFQVPLVARLSLKELGLLDTIFNLLGGKKYEVEYAGFIRVAVHGVTIKVPVKYKEEIKLKF